MKKTYIKPEIEIVAYEAEPMMVILSAAGTLDETEDGGETEDPNIEADAITRRGEWGNLWSEPVEEVMPTRRW
ncbi:MAG: hypothetical protein II269_06420 [Bacteroidaceae bacterium]|nr:hypothetical protein [Bacteroidaceae bacterium]